MNKISFYAIERYDSGYDDRRGRYERFDEDNVYRTIEACQAACDELNIEHNRRGREVWNRSSMRRYAEYKDERVYSPELMQLTFVDMEFVALVF